ncbi:oligosaccharide flippase family protein [Fulvivirga maritima]|uniref:lipopolysaccharide biosynthesis protein n=1 Tax=Fulvivirga maritima TaxID=2904247 RepID=UPI001F3417DD|nr:oligosaccharide flippase family protein [Fulvivirga maritima]UII24563.1 oligosaccharide flippase family protein [Fulvivirga maritima]
MGIVSKSSLNFSIILFIGIGLGYVNTILIFPNILTEEELGLTRILMSASSVVAQFAQLGTGNILVRFHPHIKNEKKNISLSIGLLISVFGLILATASLFLFKDYFIATYSEKSKLFTKYFYLVIPFFSSLIFFNLFDAYLRVIFKNEVPAFLNFILLRIVWLILVLLYYLDFFGLTTFLYLYVGGQTLMSILALAYIIYLKELKISFRFGSSNIEMLKKMYGFGAFTIISGLSVYLINRIDILMVGKYIGLDQVAIYSIAFYISTVITVPAQSISRTSNVLAAQAAKNDDFKTLSELYKKTALYQLLLCSLIFCLIIVNYDSIIIFLPEVYHDSFMVFALLGTSKMVEVSFGINGAIILNSKYYKIDTLLSIILLIVTFISNMYFIPKYGIEGAAFATMTSIVIFHLLRYFFILVKFKMQPFSRNYFGILLLVSLSTFITLQIPNASLFWVDVIIKSGSFSIICIPLIWWLKLSPSFNQTLVALLNQFRALLFKK